MDSEILVKVDNVSKKFCRKLKRSLWYGMQDVFGELLGSEDRHILRPHEFWAADEISFELRRGECLGLIGRNGAGKTTLLRMLNGLIKPDKGKIVISGRVGALIALGAGFNPVLTGRENIFVNGSVLGLKNHEIASKLEDIIDFAEIEEFIDTPVQSYSSGMQVRLGFAIATALEPDVLLIDEVLAVGDSKFRAKCYSRLGAISTKAAVILVSHQMHDIGRICTQGLLLKRGKVISSGKTPNVIADYNLENESGLKERHGGSMKVRLEHYAVEPQISELGNASLSASYSLVAIQQSDSVEIILSIKDADGRIALQCPFVTALPQGLTTIRLKYDEIPLGPEHFSYNLEVRNHATQEVFHVVENAGTFVVVGAKRYLASLISKPSSFNIV